MASLKRFPPSLCPAERRADCKCIHFATPTQNFHIHGERLSWLLHRFGSVHTSSCNFCCTDLLFAGAVENRLCSGSFPQKTVLWMSGETHLTRWRRHDTLFCVRFVLSCSDLVCRRRYHVHDLEETLQSMAR